MPNIIPVVCDDPTPGARAANIAALAMQQVGPDNVLAVNGPDRIVYVPDDAEFQIPGNLRGEGHTFCGSGNIARITSASGLNGKRYLERFGFANLDEEGQPTAVLGSHITLDLQQDLKGLVMDKMQFGKGSRHIDGERLNTTTGTLLGAEIRDSEFTEATHASRMFRHAIGYIEENCETHHNEAGLWFANGANAVSVARANIHGHFHHQQRYGIFAGGSLNGNAIDGINIKSGSSFHNNSLLTLTNNDPHYKWGDLIFETQSTGRILGIRFEDGVDMGPPTVGQVERVCIAPAAGGYIGAVHLGDMLQYGPTVPLVSFANTSKLKVSRNQWPVPDERTSLTSAGIIYRIQNRDGAALQQAISAIFLVSVVDAATSANSCQYIVAAAGNSNGPYDGCCNQWMLMQRGTNVGASATPFYLSTDGGTFQLGFVKGSMAKVIATVKCLSAYHG